MYSTINYVTLTCVKIKKSSATVTTVNSLMFARELFGDFGDHVKIAKINTSKHVNHLPR